MDKTLQEEAGRIVDAFNPVSIFLYGSRARADFLPDSDYELGVLYREGHKISRSSLAQLSLPMGVVAYPFEYEALQEGRIDTPFPERIYLRDLGLSGRTVWGEKIVEHLALPPIRVVDALQTLVFQTGVALSAVLSYRGGDAKTTANTFPKSCLLGARCVVLAGDGTFPTGYDSIAERVLRMDIGEYAELVEHARAVRGGVQINPAMLFKNISFHNQFIKPKIMRLLETRGAGHILFQ